MKTKKAYNNHALANSSVSDWHRYINGDTSTPLLVRAIFVSATVSLYGGLCVGLLTTINRLVVCQLVQSATLIGIGAVVLKLLNGDYNV